MCVRHRMARGRRGKMAMNVPCVAVRGSTGISLSYGPPKYEDVTAFIKDDSKSCKAMVYSPDGKYLAWISSPIVKIALCSTWKVVATIEKPKVYAIQFSPLSTYLMTWEPFIVSQGNPQGSPQLHIWKSENGELVKSFTQKRQIDWEPQWSSDEKLCGILINNDIVFYENQDFDKITQRINWSKVTKYRISPGVAPHHIVSYMPGKAGQPSLCYLFQYPQVDVAQALAKKSFFQADRVDIYWNNLGTSALIMTTMDVDKTGASYYGKQSLHYVNTKGDTLLVTLSEKGPIHALEWSPKGTEFCVMYGFMPSNATIFNLECQPVFEFGKKHRNSIYYNPHGNIILLGGFGNLRGNVELWDNKKRKLIASSEAPDTTLLQWSPDGEHFMTATTAPRLRMSNGFKIWHYTGTLLYERPWNKQEELWEVKWQVFPPNSFVEKPITYKAVEGIEPSQPQASKEVYRPPSARGHTISFNLHDGVDTSTQKGRNPSKATLKLKKNREAKKARKVIENNLDTIMDTPDTNSNGQDTDAAPKSKKNPTTANTEVTGDAEKAKKIRTIERKLDNIAKLKKVQEAGKKLELNQLEKIKREDELLKELHELKL